MSNFKINFKLIFIILLTISFSNTINAQTVLEATKIYTPEGEDNIWLNGELFFMEAQTINIPEKIPVTEGNSGNHWITVYYGESPNNILSIQFYGGADVSTAYDSNGNANEEQVQKGQYYYKPTSAPAVISARYIKLEVNNGDAHTPVGKTSVEWLVSEDDLPTGLWARDKNDANKIYTVYDVDMRGQNNIINGTLQLPAYKPRTENESRMLIINSEGQLNTAFIPEEAVNTPKWNLATDRNVNFSSWNLIQGGVTLNCYNDANTAAIPLALSAREFYFHSGNVGIGTNQTSGAKLTASGQTEFQLKLEDTGTNGCAWYLGATSDSWGAKGGKFVIDKDRNSAGAEFTIDDAGNVGIGTVNPETKLHVNGKIKATEIETDNNLKINGNVKIGNVTNASSCKLAVDGKIGAEEVEIQVSINDIGDFVFDDDYELKSLAEVEDYVKKHKHLPEIKPATEIAAEGLQLTEMNLKLLIKVEELTLYTIEQEKQLKAQEQQINKQNKRIEQLAKEIELLKN